jgi:CO/xanthine dehydrogenase Mo-binding subunit
MTIEPVGVGLRLPRLEVNEKVTGRAQYIADLSRPGMLHAALLGSPHAHAIIRHYDVSEALAMPGVHAVLTGADFPDGRMGAFIKDEHAIAKDKVRYFGEPVAVVAADTEAQARAAVRAINIDYEELPAILTPEDALLADAPIIHEDLDRYVKVFDTGSSRNICSRSLFSEGDADRAWGECDLIVEGNFETEPQAHLSIEPCGALAEVDGQGRVTLWSANQSVFRVQASVCESLKLPMSKLRSLTPRIGAGFGNKMEAHVQPIVTWLALKTGRPIKLILTREEDFEIVRARHPFKYRVKTGVKADGTFVARELEVLLDGGAYADDSPGVLGNALMMGRGPYRFPHVKAHGVLVYTNKLRFGAFRGFGGPQIVFGAEQQIDEIGRRLGIDAFELRRKNMIRDGDPWFGGGKIGSNGFSQCLDELETASDWKNRSNLAARPGKKRGLGMAAAAHISGLLATGAIVRMLEDGSIVLNTGATDIGQGSDTALTQLVCEVLKIPHEQVSVASPDTDGSPYNWGTTASRVTFTTGRSVVNASREVEKQILQHASEMLECAVEDTEIRPGAKVGIKGVPKKELDFAAIAGRAHWTKGGPILGSHSWVYDQPTIDPKRAVAIGLPFPSYGGFTFGALMVDVEVDETTGQVEVLRAWSAIDVGKAVNPMAVEGQIEGAFAQGMGFALMEEMVWDGARLANPTMMDYKAPTSLDVPYEIHSLIVEAADPEGPFGAKGCGEIGINSVAAAIANAVAAATGVRFNQLPLKPERILRGMLAEAR